MPQGQPHAPRSLPALGWADETWEGGLIPAIGPAATRLSHYGQSYRSAVPPHIADLDIEVESFTAQLAREAEIELTRFDVEAGSRLRAFGPILLRSEASSSSQIENLTASARQIFNVEAGVSGSGNATEIAANSRAMIEAIALSDSITPDAVKTMHRTLMSGQRKHTPGEYRSEPVWIGRRAESPVKADYVAPNHALVPELMTDLTAYANRSDLRPLEQIAITHAQFETIHPFSDGNGRTGRALAQSMLRHTRVTRDVVVPVSAGLLADVSGYHRALTAYREGDPNPIVHAFAAAALRAVPNGRHLVTDLGEISEGWHEAARPRPESVKAKVLEFAITQPVFTAESIAATFGISPSNIYRYLKELQDIGILAMHGEHQGPRVWRAPAVLAAIDAFAERSGRRSK